MFTRKLITGLIVVGLIGLVAAQFVRFVVPQFKIENPPSEYTVTWDSPETEDLWRVACADCHSHDTVYPFYSYIAPFGWLVAYDVNKGRDSMNIATDEYDVEEMIETIEDGDMPPSLYLPLHPAADLSPQEKLTLIDGLRRTFNSTPSINNSGGDDGGDDD